MKKRIFVSLLLFGFLLFVSCKSSLYDLCPNLFSESTAEKTETHLPACHETSSLPDSSPSQERQCQCPLAFLDYTLGSESVGKFVTNFQSFPTVATHGSFFSVVSPDSRLSVQTFRNRDPIDAKFHFLKTVRLLI
jgi:hypothetical protein